jgi:hypothetical protein
VAVMVATCAVVTEDTAAVNPALAELAGIANVAGSVTAGSLLARLTMSPLAGATAVSDTVQAAEAVPVTDPELQVSAPSVLNTPAPIPLPLNGIVI